MSQCSRCGKVTSFGGSLCLSCAKDDLAARKVQQQIEIDALDAFEAALDDFREKMQRRDCPPGLTMREIERAGYATGDELQALNRLAKRVGVVGPESEGET
jgi:hypothetical protein